MGKRLQNTESRSGNPWAFAASLALRDLWHDRRTTFVLVFTIAAILAPLLLLFGLKTGVVSAMRDALLNDPRNLEIVIYGNTRLGQDWFRAYARRPDVAFIVPKTRTINATLDLVNRERRILSAVEAVPTAPGDPLLPPDLPVPVDPSGVLVTETLAKRLDIRPSDSITGLVKRINRGRDESAMLDLRVIAIVPESSFSKRAIFTTPDLLALAEDYRDGLRATLSNSDLRKGAAAQRPHFANARVYAADLEDVASISDAMRSDGIEVRTQAEAIESVRAIDRILSFVFYVIALIASTGCALALGGALWVNMDRKHRDLALLRLFGFDNQAVILLPVVQSLTISAAGFAMAYAAYRLGALTFNQILGANLADQGYVCHVDAGDILRAAGATLVIALAAASAGGFRASRIDAAESLRERQ